MGWRNELAEWTGGATRPQDYRRHGLGWYCTKGQSGSAASHVKPRASGQAAFVPRRTCGPGSGQVCQPDLTIRDVAVDAFCGEVIAGRIRGHVPDLMVLCELRNDVVPLDVRVGIGG